MSTRKPAVPETRKRGEMIRDHRGAPTLPGRAEAPQPDSPPAEPLPVFPRWDKDRDNPLGEPAPTAETPRFVCKARASATDPPQDCDWPHCGCDPNAERVLSALEEAGYTLAPSRLAEPTAEPPKPDCITEVRVCQDCGDPFPDFGVSSRLKCWICRAKPEPPATSPVLDPLESLLKRMDACKVFLGELADKVVGECIAALRVLKRGHGARPDHPARCLCGVFLDNGVCRFVAEAARALRGESK